MPPKTEQRQLTCQNGQITYLLTRKKVKNINLRIKPDGSILVSANNRVSVDYIDDFIKRKQSFIFSALEKYEEIRKCNPKLPKQYKSGEKLRLCGKDLELDVIESMHEEVLTDGNFIYLKVKDTENFRHKEILLTRWLKEYQKEIFKKVIDKVNEKFKEHDEFNVPYPEFKVRYMTSCWGTCHTRKKFIILNSRLIEAPMRCIEYVVVHEFAHFVQPNHSKQFWNVVTIIMPDWKERRKELEKQA